MSEVPRRLPRSNAPHPEESLAGYLLNLAYRLEVPPHELVRRTGIKPTGRVSLLDLTYATSLPPAVRKRFATTTGLSDTEVVNLTTERFGETLQMGRHSKPVARTEYGNQWLTPGRSRVCPQCLGEPGPNQALWRVHWATAWAVACSHHGTLLLDTCPYCQTPIGEPGQKGFRSLIPQLTVPDVHPAACRAWNGPKSVCGARLDQLNAPSAHPDLIGLQHRLNQALNDAIGPERVLSGPVNAHQWLRDLRTTQILLQVARDNETFAGVPYGPAAAAFVQERTPNVGREVKGTRTSTQAPQDTAAAAGLLLAADRLLGSPGQPERLNLLAQVATTAKPVLWASVRTSTHVSDGLSEALALHRKRLTQPVRLRAYTHGRVYTYQPQHVPAYLDAETFRRYFEDVRGPSSAVSRSRYERPLRRYVPIALVMLVTADDTTTAGQFLGYDKTLINAGTARASEAFRDLGEPELLRRVVAIAAELDTAPRIDWQRRRAWFTSDWTIPDHHWANLMRAVPRKNTPWDKRRPALAAWIWAQVTSGDIKDAPMTRTVLNGRVCTGGASKETYDLIRRSGPTLERCVRDLADHIAAGIDADAVAYTTPDKGVTAN